MRAHARGKDCEGTLGADEAHFTAGVLFEFPENHGFLRAFTSQRAASSPDATALADDELAMHRDDALLTLVSNYEDSLAGKDALAMCYDCYCRDILTSNGTSVLLNDQYRTECYSVLQNVVKQMLATYGALVGVVVVNALLRVLLQATVAMEGHETQSKVQSSIFMKIFVAQFVNTAILTLVINGHVESVVTPISVGTVSVFDGTYPDFNKEWYKTVGIQTLLTLLITGLLHVFASLGVAFLAVMKRSFCVRRKYFTQLEMNEAHLGPEYRFAVKVRTALDARSEGQYGPSCARPSL